MLNPRRLLASMPLAALSVSVFAQGLPPKDKAEDYPVHATLSSGLNIAAEYLVHTLPTKQGALVANDYLVVEVAIFGEKSMTIELSAANFTLRINKKTEIVPDAPGYVAASLKYPDWQNSRRVDLSGGVGNATVVYGPPQANRFPGDPTVRPPRTQPLPEENPAGIEKEAPVPIEDRVERAALPSGEQIPPVAGAICFPFRGKTKSIKSIELLYKGPGGEIAMKLE